MTQQTPTAPAGWYPDPDIPGGQRWWDGQSWGPRAPVPQPPVPSVSPAPTSARRFAVGALVLGVIAMLFASNAIGLLVGIAAISSGVVAHRRGRKLAVAATTLGVLAVSGAVFSLISSGFAATDRNIEPMRADAPAQRAEAELADTAAQVGETVTSDAGVEFTVVAVECGTSTAGDGVREKTARGQFCAVDVRLANQGSKPVSIWVNDITGRIGPNIYEAEWSASDLGGDLWNADLNPGLAAEAVLYFDVPPSAELDTIVLDTGLFDDEVEVAVH